VSDDQSNPLEGFSRENPVKLKSINMYFDHNIRESIENSLYFVNKMNDTSSKLGHNLRKESVSKS
jgi:hypothetical protein